MFSFIIVMVVVCLSILISWFFEIYESRFEQEHEIMRHRALVMEEHKNDIHGEHHKQHHQDVEKSLSRLFLSLKRTVRPPICHIEHTKFAPPVCGVHCTLRVCDICLRPTSMPSCKDSIIPQCLSTSRKAPRLQWIIAPKFVHVVLQVSLATRAAVQQCFSQPRTTRVCILTHLCPQI